MPRVERFFAQSKVSDWSSRTFAAGGGGDIVIAGGDMTNVYPNPAGGLWEVHTFTSSGNLTVHAGEITDAEIYIGAGAGAGGFYPSGGGGGGAGELLKKTGEPLSATGGPGSNGVYPIVIGAGGAMVPERGGDGGDTTAFSYTARRGQGGGGGYANPGYPTPGTYTDPRQVFYQPISSPVLSGSAYGGGGGGPAIQPPGYPAAWLYGGSGGLTAPSLSFGNNGAYQPSPAAGAGGGGGSGYKDPDSPVAQYGGSAGPVSPGVFRGGNTAGGLSTNIIDGSTTIRIAHGGYGAANNDPGGWSAAPAYYSPLAQPVHPTTYHTPAGWDTPAPTSFSNYNLANWCNGGYGSTANHDAGDGGGGIVIVRFPVGA
jgi:hypothetical protein